jgi:hypothetical protein
LQLSTLKHICTSAADVTGNDEVEEVEATIAPETHCKKAMDDFINAKQCKEKCHHKIMNIHFGNNDLCKSLSHLINCIHILTSSIAPIISQHCCACCTPRLPTVCCDICHPTHFWLPPNLNMYEKPLRCTQTHNPKPYTMGAQEQGLRSALVDMHTQLTKEYLPKECTHTPGPPHNSCFRAYHEPCT